MLLANNLIGKIPDLCNAKEHYQPSVRKKNTKSVKPSEIITYLPKTFENPNIVDIKLIITEHPKTSHILFKTIREGGKIGSLYNDTKMVKILPTKKM